MARRGRPSIVLGHEGGMHHTCDIERGVRNETKQVKVDEIILPAQTFSGYVIEHDRESDDEPRLRNLGCLMPMFT